MIKYDFFVAGRWRNHETVKETLDVIRTSGRTAYCFIENPYSGEKVSFDIDGDIEKTMQKLESLPGDDEYVKRIFETDLIAEKASANFLLVLPAGISSHIEAGIAYGMNKPCYALGSPVKTETLYSIFNQIFPDTSSLEEWLAQQDSR